MNGRTHVEAGRATAEIRRMGDGQDRAEPASLATDSDAEIDLAAFDAPLWVLPPAPPEPEKPPVPVVTPPLKLQLVGIESSGSRTQAVMFDPELAEILRAAVGANVREHIVRSIDSGSVVLESRDGKATHRLVMRRRVSVGAGENPDLKTGGTP